MLLSSTLLVIRISFCSADTLRLWNGLERFFCSQFLMEEFVQMFKLSAEQIIWDVILKQW